MRRIYTVTLRPELAGMSALSQCAPELAPNLFVLGPAKLRLSGVRSASRLKVCQSSFVVRLVCVHPRVQVLSVCSPVSGWVVCMFEASRGDLTSLSVTRQVSAVDAET